MEDGAVPAEDNMCFVYNKVSVMQELLHPNVILNDTPILCFCREQSLGIR